MAGGYKHISVQIRESLAATGETLPEAAEITLKQEKEVSERAELILQWEKLVL